MISEGAMTILCLFVQGWHRSFARPILQFPFFALSRQFSFANYICKKLPEIARMQLAKNRIQTSKLDTVY
jgi:hypothetical protein